MSPVRASERGRYPADWRTIAWGVKARAGWRCECHGECGSPKHTAGRCPAIQGHANPATGSTVVLTAAHLDHTPENCDPANLRAMCQLCHLAYDQEHHARTRGARERAPITTTTTTTRSEKA